MIYTDFQPYLLPGTDAWALSPDKSMELLNYLEDIGIKQVGVLHFMGLQRVGDD